jgi:hypothetical protein
MMGWLGLTGCPTNGLHQGIFYKYGGNLRYRIGPLRKTWRQIKVTENDLAFYHPQYKATIQINSTCRKDYEDASLSTLTDHIFIGLREKKILRQSKRLIDRRAALYTEIVAKLDGVRVTAATIVLKKNACIYDLTYIARPGNFGRGLGEFHRVVHGFKVL